MKKFALDINIKNERNSTYELNTCFDLKHFLIDCVARCEFDIKYSLTHDDPL